MQDFRVRISSIWMRSNAGQGSDVTYRTVKKVGPRKEKSRPKKVRDGGNDQVIKREKKKYLMIYSIFFIEREDVQKDERRERTQIPKMTRLTSAGE